MLKEAWRLIADFEADISDLSTRLALSERTIARLTNEATQLHEEIERLRRENDDLTRRNEELRRALHDKS